MNFRLYGTLLLLDLRLRFSHLGIPIRFGPQSMEEASRDVENSLKFS